MDYDLKELTEKEVEQAKNEDDELEKIIKKHKKLSLNVESTMRTTFLGVFVGFINTILGVSLLTYASARNIYLLNQTISLKEKSLNLEQNVKKRNSNLSVCQEIERRIVPNLETLSLTPANVNKKVILQSQGILRAEPLKHDGIPILNFDGEAIHPYYGIFLDEQQIGRLNLATPNNLVTGIEVEVGLKKILAEPFYKAVQVKVGENIDLSSIENSYMNNSDLVFYEGLTELEPRHEELMTQAQKYIQLIKEEAGNASVIIYGMKKEEIPYLVSQLITEKTSIISEGKIAYFANEKVSLNTKTIVVNPFHRLASWSNFFNRIKKHTQTGRQVYCLTDESQTDMLQRITKKFGLENFFYEVNLH